MVKALLVPIAGFVRTRPPLKRAVQRLLVRFPALRSRLDQLIAPDFTPQVTSSRHLKELVRVFLVRGAEFGRNNRQLKRAAERFLVQFPTLRSRMEQLVAANPAPAVASPQDAIELAQLPVRAREIYAHLKEAIERRR